LGYGKALETFDKQLIEIIPLLNNDDLLLITADHGNDPTFKGTDHTREFVPLFAYHNQIKEGSKMEVRNTFADVGATISENFNVTSRSEEHTSELQSRFDLVCRLLLEKK